MSVPTIHRSNRTFSASAILDAVAADLTQIREEDGLTYAELGTVLGKSGDQAEKYTKGTAEMGVVAYARAKREWNGRFAGSVNRLIAEARGEVGNDRDDECALIRAVMALADALADDGEVSTAEVHQHRAVFERAAEAIAHQLGKLTPRSAA
jgi:hypothetical protein